jgi:hypothetical protein
MKKRLIITEEEQNRILKMHKTAINDSYLNNFNGKKITIKEQILDDDGPEETPKESKIKDNIKKYKKKGKDVFDKLKDKIIPKDEDEEGDEEGDEEDGVLDIFKGHKTNKMDDIVKKAWEAVKIYARANNLKRKTMFSEDNKNVWQYYTIKGIDFYDDGYKVINPAKPEEQERYSEDDDALTIENKPLVTVVPDNKSETKVTNEPLKLTPTPTKKIISTNDDNF